jgi:hypothetical protein
VGDKVTLTREGAGRIVPCGARGRVTEVADRYATVAFYAFPAYTYPMDALAHSKNNDEYDD